MDKIAAVVLAAGVGTRMLPLTLDMPKPMLTIGGKNLIAVLQRRDPVPRQDVGTE